jgi:hypothetical protein
MQYGIVEGRIQRLEKAEEEQAARAEDWAWYNFRVAPSCPPDQRVHMRGGLLWNPYPGDYYAWQVPNATCDLTDGVQTFVNYYSWRGGGGFDVPATLSWSNQYWYKVFTLVLRLHDFDAANITFTLCELEDYQAEYETAAEAEAAWPDTVGTWQEAWYTDGYPLCGLILRNDGTSTGFQPIDVVNRGRSYIWPRDCRPMDYLV